MFGRYTLPRDDMMLELNPTITVVNGTEDPAYPITNWLFNKPAKPAKFTTPNCELLFDFGAAVNIAAFALIYHNLDPGLPCTVSWDSDPGFSPAVGSQSITIPDWTEDGWSVNPWSPIPGSPTYRYWLLEIGGGSPGTNTLDLSIGRPMFLGACRDLTNDVRWGEEENEEHPDVVHPTLLGDDTIFRLGNKRRRFAGEFALRGTSLVSLQPEQDIEHAQELIALHRSAQGRVKPWILIPDVDVNEAWMVRFEENRWSRTREMIDQNIFPFRVKEMARGWPWPAPA